MRRLCEARFGVGAASCVGCLRLQWGKGEFAPEFGILGAVGVPVGPEWPRCPGPEDGLFERGFLAGEVHVARWTVLCPVDAQAFGGDAKDDVWILPGFCVGWQAGGEVDLPVLAVALLGRC